MTMNQIWKKLLKKYPVANDPEKILSFKSKNLKKLLVQVYNKGRTHKKSKDGFDEIFDDLL